MPARPSSEFCRRCALSPLRAARPGLGEFGLARIDKGAWRIEFVVVREAQNDSSYPLPPRSAGRSKAAASWTVQHAPAYPAKVKRTQARSWPWTAVSPVWASLYQQRRRVARHAGEVAPAVAQQAPLGPQRDRLRAALAPAIKQDTAILVPLAAAVADEVAAPQLVVR